MIMTDEEIRKHNQEWYKKTYNNLIEKCKQMDSDGELTGIYTETHHILPKCMGGTDESTNLVKLPARYHIVAHLLLIKIYPGQSKLAYAAHMMLTCASSRLKDREDAQKRISTRTYAMVREEVASYRKGVPRDPETIRKMSIGISGEKHPFYGKHRSEETCRKVSEARFGMKYPPEFGKNISERQKGIPFSEKAQAKAVYSRTHWVMDPEGNVYEHVKDAAKAHRITAKKLSAWLYSDDTHGYKFIEIPETETRIKRRAKDKNFERFLDKYDDIPKQNAIKLDNNQDKKKE